MPQDTTIRQDPLTGLHSMVAPARFGLGGGLPTTPAALPPLRGRCPFCPGHESDSEVTVVARPPTGPWRIRVVRNLYPVIDQRTGIESLLTADAAAAAATAAASGGVHEVLIESSDHDLDLADMDPGALAEVLDVYRERYASIGSVAGVESVAMFRNRGLRAGSSQPHPHGQILGLPVVPAAVRVRAQRAREHAMRTGRGLLADVIAAERAAGLRVVTENAAVLAFCPFAPLGPFHVSVVPAAGTGDFAVLSVDAVTQLAAVLSDALGRVLRATGRAAYNLVFRLPPWDLRAAPDQYWAIDILPRLGGPAGFELTTGDHIVTIAPEVAARALRELAPGGP